MKIQNRLRALFSEILKEVEKNPDFAGRLEGIFGSESKSEVESEKTTNQSARKGRRSLGILDPFAIFEKTPAELSMRLEQLSVEQLKDVVAEHGMDRSKLVMKWKNKEKLIPFIVKTVSSRSTKGDAFRQTSIPPLKEAAKQLGREMQVATRVAVADLEKASVQELLRAADIITIHDPRTDFYEQLYGQQSVASGRAPGTGPYLIKQVEIDINSANARDIEQSRAIVQKLRN